ncbi:MAG TPA: hypothetical protein PKC18_10685 [Lacipirellulaceae bacterium]|nr:hypothetical protein [Lacipirellulaceae bacterium]
MWSRRGANQLGRFLFKRPARFVPRRALVFRQRHKVQDLRLAAAQDAEQRYFEVLGLLAGDHALLDEVGKDRFRCSSTLALLDLGAQPVGLLGVDHFTQR